MIPMFPTLQSAEIVDEIYKAKEGSNSRELNNNNNNNNNHSRNLKLSSNLAAPSNQLSPAPRRANYGAGPSPNPTRVELDVQVLNHCFDDIERFVARLQTAADVHRELQSRQRQRGAKQPRTKQPGRDG